MATTTASGSGAEASASKPRMRNDKRRAANLLRDYYGLSSDAPSASSSPSLDSTAGDSKRKGAGPDVDLNSLLRSNSLSVLLGKESELIVQIRELDGERQSLVYNHHHELVAASDTIRNMKLRSESLDPSLDSLKSCFESMSTLSSHLDSLRPKPPQPSTHPTKDDDGQALRDLDLEPIVTLPTSLADLIECRHAGADTDAAPAPLQPDAEARRAGLAQAEHLWGTMEPVLAAWTDAGVGGVREVAAECRALLKDGRKALSSPAAS
ncbi:hypothetical protein L1887_62767 [Cichorium endivia]|uniref:Vacuolar protein sorting-associated protein 51 homolog n=1 Tax=Pseudozyma antarctica (strain T-34) TaxID=1151754 RepID=M9M7N9_PSEA3|nr:hypothetical protein L1887_62767 [Cichorium endivia]GAC77155.1 hypothetical protein PANT_25c00004 [Moesziomyces antarcticus T-34]